MSIRIASKVETKELEALLGDMSGAQTMAQLLSLTVQRLSSWPGVALARAWTQAPGDLCSTCALRPSCEDRTRCLHLVASAGRSRSVAGAEWTALNGDHRRIPLGHGKVGRAAQLGKARHLPRLDPASPWVEDADWVRSEGIRGFSAQPVTADQKTVAVLAVFTRMPLSPTALGWLERVAERAGLLAPMLQRLETAEQAAEEFRAELDRLHTDQEGERGYDRIVARSEGMARVTDQIAVAAPIRQEIFIHGEPGTGKELVARAIHKAGPRADRPCRALAAGDITGGESLEDRLAVAKGGTLVVRDAHRLRAGVLDKLLARARELDIRVLALSRNPLPSSQALSVFPIRIPTLGERIEDVPDLTRLFLTQFAHKAGVTAPEVSAAQVSRLARRPWAGNVRELRELLRMAFAVSEPGKRLRLAPPADFAPEEDRLLTADDLRRLETENLRQCLEETGWKVSGAGGAAERLGMRPTTLASRIRALGLVRPRRRPTS